MTRRLTPSLRCKVTAVSAGIRHATRLSCRPVMIYHESLRWLWRDYKPAGGN
jgi:hypothetical protein